MPSNKWMSGKSHEITIKQVGKYHQTLRNHHHQPVKQCNFSKKYKQYHHETLRFMIYPLAFADSAPSTKVVHEDNKPLPGLEHDFRKMTLHFLKTTYSL
jgi:hypothetical protein